LRVLKELFVPIKAAYDNVTYSGEVVDVLGGSMRVGDPGYFDRYFHFGVPPGDLSDVTVGQAIQEVASEAQGVATAEIPRMLLENPRLVISTDPGSSGTKIRLGSQVGLFRRRGVPQGPEGACRQLVLGEGVPSPCKYDNSAQWFKKQFSGRTVPFTYYLLQNGHSSLCLNVEGGSTANGASIIQWPCDNSKNNEQIRFWIY